MHFLCYCCVFLNKFPLTEEDMMTDSEQVAPAGHSTENLTELGKCLLKHEVRILKRQPWPHFKSYF